MVTNWCDFTDALLIGMMLGGHRKLAMGLGCPSAGHGAAFIKTSYLLPRLGVRLGSMIGMAKRASLWHAPSRPETTDQSSCFRLIGEASTLNVG